MSEKFSKLGAYEKLLIALSVLAFAFLIIDPMVLAAVRGTGLEAHPVLRFLTYFGKYYFVLIVSGALIAVLAGVRAQQISPRRYAGYGLAQRLLTYLFATVALSGMFAVLLKNILGRARPELFDKLGAVYFQPFSFENDFTAFPSLHATTAGALAGVLALIWPCARVPLFVAAAWVASARFLTGAHYFTDTVAGCLLGLGFAYFLRRRLAQRGWLFRSHDDGSISLRGGLLIRSASRSMVATCRVFTRDVLERFALDKTPRQ